MPSSYSTVILGKKLLESLIVNYANYGFINKQKGNESIILSSPEMKMNHGK